VYFTRRNKAKSHNAPQPDEIETSSVQSLKSRKAYVVLMKFCCEIVPEPPWGCSNKSSLGATRQAHSANCLCPLSFGTVRCTLRKKIKLNKSII